MGFESESADGLSKYIDELFAQQRTQQAQAQIKRRGTGLTTADTLATMPAPPSVVAPVEAVPAPAPTPWQGSYTTSAGKTDVGSTAPPSLSASTNTGLSAGSSDAFRGYNPQGQKYYDSDVGHVANKDTNAVMTGLDNRMNKPDTRLYKDGVPGLNKGLARVPGEGDEDTEHFMLAPGEAVLNEGAAQAMGRKKIAALNAEHADEGAKSGLRGGVMHAAAGYVGPEQRPKFMQPNMQQIPQGISNALAMGPSTHVVGEHDQLPYGAPPARNAPAPATLLPKPAAAPTTAPVAAAPALDPTKLGLQNVVRNSAGGLMSGQSENLNVGRDANGRLSITAKPGARGETPEAAAAAAQARQDFMAQHDRVMNGGLHSAEWNRNAAAQEMIKNARYATDKQFELGKMQVDATKENTDYLRTERNDAKKEAALGKAATMAGIDPKEAPDFIRHIETNPLYGTDKMFTDMSPEEQRKNLNKYRAQHRVIKKMSEERTKGQAFDTLPARGSVGLRGAEFSDANESSGYGDAVGLSFRDWWDKHKANGREDTRGRMGILYDKLRSAVGDGTYGNTYTLPGGQIGLDRNVGLDDEHEKEFWNYLRGK